MKRTRTALLWAAALYLLLGAVVLSLPGSGGRVDQPYRYPVVPGTEEWRALPDLRAKIAACEVDRELMESMTTPALLQTVLDYPLLVNVFAFDTSEMGLSAVSTYFDGIDLLARREDAAKVIREYAPEEGDTLSGAYLRVLLRHIEGASAKQ